MPRVVFEKFGEPPRAVDAAAGEALVDVCDDARAPVEFSCRSASCGTCRVEVLSGAGLLAPSSEDERDVLDLFDRPERHRLACQAKLAALRAEHRDLELRLGPGT